MGALRREMMSWKWTVCGIGYQCVFAYIVALNVYQIGMLIQGNGFGIGTLFAFLSLAGILFLLLKKPYKPAKETSNLQKESAVR